MNNRWIYKILASRYSLLLDVGVAFTSTWTVVEASERFKWHEFDNLSFALLWILFVVILNSIKINIITKWEEIFTQSFSQFLGKVDFEKTTKIEIFAHTGESTVTQLLQYIDNIKISSNLKINIVIREPSVEAGKRRNGILRTLDKIEDIKAQKRINITVRFYQSLPYIRLINIYQGESVISNYLGFYYFVEGKSKAYVKELSDKIRLDSDLQIIASSWFSHFWGKSNKNLFFHTIILDFDDTITNSHPVQIDAWIEVINECIELGIINISNLKLNIKNIYNNSNKIKEEVGRIFFTYQNATDILNNLFVDISDSIKDKIQRRRFEIRRQKFKEKQDNLLFEGVKETLNELEKDYNLVILSATNESLIKEFLTNQHLYINGDSKSMISLFQLVFGSHEPKLDIKSLKSKSQLILKLSNIIGVSSNRLIYIGDSQDDWNSCNEIGIPFIEARLFSEEIKKAIGNKALINSEGLKIKHFEKWKELPIIIKEFENEMKNR